MSYTSENRVELGLVDTVTSGPSRGCEIVTELYQHVILRIQGKDVDNSTPFALLCSMYEIVHRAAREELQDSRAKAKYISVEIEPFSGASADQISASCNLEIYLTATLRENWDAPTMAYRNMLRNATNDRRGYLDVGRCLRKRDRNYDSIVLHIGIPRFN